jgi:dihydroorotate dehydrogenase (NAD+) catalytic subunit
MSLTLSNGKRELILDPALTNVAGTLGFSGETQRLLDLSRLGAFITNPISLTARKPCQPPRVLSFAGGFLLHTGHPNPGLSQVIRQHHQAWKELPCPVIVHLLGQLPQEVAIMVERLEEVEPVHAVEVGCGDCDPELVIDLLAPALLGELPVLANFPLNCEIAAIQAAAQAGAVAISLGPPRGALSMPEGQLLSGRLFGPALYPFALGMVLRLSSMIDLPIIASGGIYDEKHIQAMLSAGAAAVQLDGILWTEPEKVL